MRSAHLLAAVSLAVSTIASGFAQAANIQNSSAGAASCPAFEVRQTSEQLLAHELISNPLVLELTAGGELDLMDCSELPGVGFVAKKPDVTLTLSGTEHLGLDLFVLGSCDTMILMNAADGSWHYGDDFEGGPDPMLTIEGGSSGQYDIWVGTFEPSTCAAALFVEAFDPLLIS
jgi:hypothetical protein